MCVHWKEESVLQAGGKSLLKKEFYANMILCELLFIFFYAYLSFSVVEEILMQFSICECDDDARCPVPCLIRTPLRSVS